MSVFVSAECVIVMQCEMLSVVNLVGSVVRLPAWTRPRPRIIANTSLLKPFRDPTMDGKKQRFSKNRK